MGRRSSDCARSSEPVTGIECNFPQAIAGLHRILAAVSPTRELDRLRESLRGQIPEKAVFGITEAFSISVEKLDKISRRAVMVIAQLASAPVPEDFFDALPAKLGSPAVRACLRSRHFVGDGGTSDKGEPGVRSDAPAYGRLPSHPCSKVCTRITRDRV